MNFIAKSKSEWIEFAKQHANFQEFSNDQLSEIYDGMLLEAHRGIIAANALGGKWDANSEPDYDKPLTDKVDNISNAPAYQLIQVFKELYADYEKNMRNMFNDSSTDLSITPKQIAEVLYRHGLEDYAPQVYIFFGAMYAGCAYNISTVLQDVKGWVAAFRMADELNVPVSEINPQKALEYYADKDRHIRH